MISNPFYDDKNTKNRILNGISYQNFT